MPRLSKIGAAALAAFGWTGLSSVTASYLVVAGGGSGGGMIGGGGGAGGYQAGTTSLNPTQSYTVIVGAGGAGTTSAYIEGNQGSNSSFSTITANGGGKGGASGLTTDTSGGSSGGAGGFGTRTGTASQGNLGGTTGWSGAGGGGAGAVGADTPNSNVSGGAGGAGTANSISGTSVTYAGGGGGGGYRQPGGAGGSGGGGAGGAFAGGIGVSGTANLGGGGGGGGDNSPGAGGQGGSGVVIISYVGAQQFGGGIVTSSGGNTIHTFQTSGTLSPLSSLTASYLIVAGGGSGGGQVGGGGGAGGLLSGSGVTIDTNSIYLVTVGAGGIGTSAGGTNGTNSAFSMVSTAAVGGGSGGSSNGAVVAGNGGSGGGGGCYGTAIGTGTVGQGNNGGTSIGAGAPFYPGGGGGGASSVGGNATATVAGVGGTGTASSISGTSTTYAAGASGGRYNTGSSNGVAGTANTGNGGSGSSTASAGAGEVGGNGGSGIVIISYPGATQLMAGGTVTISGGNVIHTFTSSGYLSPLTLVDNSLRFRASNNNYLARTYGTPTNNKVWTWSAWIKRGSLSLADANHLFMGTPTDVTGNPSVYTRLIFETDNTLRLQSNGSAGELFTSSAVYRDPAAWYHIVLSMNASSTVVNCFVNGTEITYASRTNPTNTNTAINGAGNFHRMGFFRDAEPRPFDGYMADINFIDGQALTPNSFGTFNSYGVWQPITYGGSYGTNGFYLPFTNTTSTTTLGYDFSPQGNNWTPNNFSLTAGSTYDSMTDVPTLTSTTAANYAVISPINGVGTALSITGANLNFAQGSGSYGLNVCSMSIKDKTYFEITLGSSSTGSGKNSYCGVGSNGSANTYSASNYFGTDSFAWSLGYSNTTAYINNNGTQTPQSGTIANGDVFMYAVDPANGRIWFGRNGTWYAGSPSAGTGASYTNLPTEVFPVVQAYDSSTHSINFGQRPFAYTAPSGFLPLNTFNL